MNTIDSMIQGYLDGFSSSLLSLPEIPKQKGSAYRHGWLNGRDDRQGKPRERADVLRRRADLILQEAA